MAMMPRMALRNCCKKIADCGTDQKKVVLQTIIKPIATNTPTVSTR
jgi:hypothetical protein